MRDKKRYVPALGYDCLTKLYDPLVALTTRERKFKQRLIRQAGIQKGHRVLDLACGTGTLAVWVKLQEPEAYVSGIDGSQKILAMAERKAAKYGVGIRFEQGFSTCLPFKNDSFDCVLSSLSFHHLSHEDKVMTIREILRILRPGGEFHVADWGKPQNFLMRASFYLVQFLDGFENTRDNVLGLLPQLFTEGGFCNVQLKEEMKTIFGTMALYSALK